MSLRACLRTICKIMSILPLSLTCTNRDTACYKYQPATEYKQLSMQKMHRPIVHQVALDAISVWTRLIVALHTRRRYFIFSPRSMSRLTEFGTIFYFCVLVYVRVCEASSLPVHVTRPPMKKSTQRLSRSFTFTSSIASSVFLQDLKLSKKSLT